MGDESPDNEASTKKCLWLLEARNPFLGRIDGRVTQRVGWKVHYNSWYDFYSYQEHQELPANRVVEAAFAATPLSPGRRFQRWLQGGEFFFLHFHFFPIEVRVERRPWFLSIVFDRYRFCCFSNEGDLQTLEPSKGWSSKTGKKLSDEICRSQSFPRHGHGWMSITFAFGLSHRYWPITTQEEHSCCRTPDQMRHWFPACARTRWAKAVVFAGGINQRKGIREQLLAADGFCFGCNFHPCDWEANHANKIAGM